VATEHADHAETALDQLRIADDFTRTAEEMRENALTAAQVHATLALAAAVRQVQASLLVAPF
jgi:hypothetical protein